MLDKIRKNICIEAETFIDTPYHTGARLKNIGVDCAGVIVLVGKANNVYNGGDYQGYSPNPDGRKLESTLKQWAGKEKHISEMLPGDILLMRFISEPQHLALYVEDNKIIHAYLRARKVVKHELDKTWKDRILKVYEYPNLEEEECKLNQ